VAVAAGIRPTRRTLAWLTILPVLSVSVVAYWYDSFFNCFVFAAIAGALAFFVRGDENEKVRRGPAWAVALGSILIAFAWIYPHFLDPSRAPATYLYAAPMGLIPCPTLSLVVGVTLVSGASTGFASAMVLALAGLFYGFVGMVKLEVDIDAVLFMGAIGLIVLWLVRPLKTTHVERPC
jgi:hypothetical protein